MNIKEVKHCSVSAFHGDYAIFSVRKDKDLYYQGLINRNGDIVVPADKYETIVPEERENLFCLCQDVDSYTMLFTYYDAKLGKEVPEPKRETPKWPERFWLPDFAQKYEEAYWVALNRIMFKEGELYGLMDENGKVIVPPTYIHTQRNISTNNKIRVRRKDDKESYIDSDGNALLPFEYHNVRYNEENRVYLFGTEEGDWGIMDEKGKIIIPPVYDDIDIGSRGLDELLVVKAGSSYFINAKQEDVTPYGFRIPVRRFARV